MSGAPSSQSHPGLSFPNHGLRRNNAYQPHPLSSTNKPPTSLSQHPSPYQNQPYPPPQPPASAFGHHHGHLYHNPAAPQVSGVTTVQNAARPPPSQAPPSLPGPRQQQQQQQQQQQRVPPSRMQQSNAPLSYLHQALGPQSLSQQPMNPQQPMNQQQPMNPQQLSQQSMGQQSMSQQSMGQQPMNQQAMGQQSLVQQPLGQQSLSQQPLSQQPLGQQSLNHQPLNQQSLGQQSMAQPPMSQQPMSQPPMSQLQLQPMSQPPMSQSLAQQQSLSQPPQQQNENPIIPQQTTPRPLPQPTLPPAPPKPPQVQQVQKVHKTQQAKAQQTPPRPEPALPARDDHHDHHDHHEDDMEMGSGDEGEGDSALVPRALDGSPNYVAREPMGPMMSPPPEGGSFPSLDAISKYVLDYCTSVGYAVVIGRSKKTAPGLKKVLYVCDRSGKPPKRINPELRKRKTTSRKCDCPFGFFAIEQRTQWIVRHRPDQGRLVHNHEPSESITLHPAARKLDSKMVAAVKTLKESGVGVTETLEILQQDHPHVPLLPRDIYNARAAISRNPQKVATALAEDRPAIYNKPQPSPEERIRADLRKELAKAREDYEKLQKDSAKEIDDLKAKLKEKERVIEKFEQFIDICNQRVIFKLSDNTSTGAGANAQ